MEENANRPAHYKQYKDFNVDLYVHDEQVENKMLRGRGLVNPLKAEFLFIENRKPQYRSKELGRTMHGRFIRTGIGNYTLTLRFSLAEKLIGSQLLSEVRNVITMAEKDHKEFVNQQKLKENGKTETSVPAEA